MPTDFTGILQQLMSQQDSLLHMASDALEGATIHARNPNGDPNNPKAKYYDLLVTEHDDPNGSSTLSHEVDASSRSETSTLPGVWLEGDQEGSAFGNNDTISGGVITNDEGCGGTYAWSEKFHETGTNLGHFSPVGNYAHHANQRSFKDIFLGSGKNDILDGKTDNDTLYGNGGNDILFGGDGDDDLYGGAGIDFLMGETGNDILYGEGEDDYLQGDLGNDLLFGGDGNDFYSFTSDSGVDYVFEDAPKPDDADPDLQDTVAFGNAVDLWVFKTGKDMILTVDSAVQNFVYIKDYEDKKGGVDYIYLGGLGGAYKAEDAWSVAVDLGDLSAATFSANASLNIPDANSWVSITTLDSVDITLAGIPALEHFTQDAAAV